MCIFCAAVPMAGSLGAMATAKQKQAKQVPTTDTASEDAAQNTQPQTVPHWLMQLPAERVTVVVIAGLIAGSALYHSQSGPV